MKRIILLVFIVLGGIKTNPQQQKSVDKKESNIKSYSDSLLLEAKKDAEKIKRNKEIVSKNLGYIWNLEQKVAKKKTEKPKVKLAKSKKEIEVTETITIPIYECKKHRTIVGSWLNKDSCKEWDVVDSLKVKIEQNAINKEF